MCDYGTSTPASEGTFRATAPAKADGQAHFDRLATGHRIDDGELVALAGGVLWTGYEGSIGRTRPCHGPRGASVPAAQRALYRRWYEVMGRVLDSCRPGATGADLLAAYTSTGEPVTVRPIATSIGIGSEGPVAGSALGAEFDATQRLEADMVLTVQAHVADESGGFFGLDTLLIAADGPEVLTTLSHGPLATPEWAE
jgi:Xaa-Pro dipeptidase